MKIGIDTLFEHPDRPSSAIDYLKNLVDWLPRAGPEYSYYVFVSPRSRHHFNRHPPNVHLVNCFISNENVPLRIAVQQSVLPLLILKLGLDVLFSPGNVCPLLGRFRRVLKINTLHHYLMPEMVGQSRSLYRRFAFVQSARRADRIVANTAATKEEICRYMRVPEKKISVVTEASYGFFTASSPAQTQDTCARYGLLGDYILFVSNLYRYKNLETLVRAFAELVAEQGIDCQLVIAGRDCESYRTDIERLAERLAISLRVRFLGFVPPNDLPALYTGARVFVYPSLQETFGKPLIEAMGCGVPVVASNTSCMPEVLGGAGRLVSPLDVLGMSLAIQEVLKDSVIRNSLIKRGLRRARDFSWEASALETLRVIEKTVAEAP